MVAYKYYRSYVRTVYCNIFLPSYRKLLHAHCSAMLRIRMFILNSGFLSFSILDLGSQTNNKKRSEKKYYLFHFIAAINVTKWKIIQFLEQVKKKIRSIDKIFNPKKPSLLSCQKYGLDPGSEIPDPDTGVKKAPDPGSATRMLSHINKSILILHNWLSLQFKERGLLPLLYLF